MNKIVNGELVTMTTAEEQEIIAEWALFDPLKELKEQAIAKVREDAIAALIAPKVAAIEGMDEPRLKAAIKNGIK